MKEFSAQTGGRYTYIDDIVNLQDLSLAFTSIFDNCDNFIISGCEISGTSISEGYVYINGKIRHFTGASGIITWPQYIYESNKTEAVTYASGYDKVGRNVYSCALAPLVPSTIDALTGKSPGFIKLESFGGLGINDALFGKYSLLLKSKAGAQEVYDRVTFKNGAMVNNSLMTHKLAIISDNGTAYQAGYDGDDLVITSKGRDSNFRFIASNKGEVSVYINDIPVLSLSNSKLIANASVQMPECIAGNISIKGNNIFNKNDGSESASININMLGLNGGYEHYRDTIIGNGKGKALVTIKGNTGTVSFSGALNVADNIFLTHEKAIIWNRGTTSVASVGFDQFGNTYEIKSNTTNIKLIGLHYVDIGPTIRENGTLLSDKYVTYSKFESSLKNKVDVLDVYSKREADDTFANISEGFTQFIGHPYSKKQLRESIDAVGIDEFEKNLKDTGWVSVGNGTSIYARQIGNIVSLQGYIELPPRDGVVFTIPADIDAPKYNVVFNTCVGDYGEMMWQSKIEGDSKECIVTRSDIGSATPISFSITYMT